MGSESSLVAKLETLPHAFDAVRAGSRHLVFEVVDERLPADRRPIGTTQLMLHGAERGLLPGEGIQHAEEGADIDPSAGEPGVPQGREGGGTVVATPTTSRPRRTLLQLVLHAGHRTLRAHESAPQQAAGAEMGDDGRHRQVEKQLQKLTEGLVVDERLPADRRPIGTTQLMLHGAERGLLPGEGIQHAEEGADIDPSAGEPGVPQGREGGGTVVATPTTSRPRRTLLQLVLHAGHRTLRAHESAPQQAAGAEMGDDGRHRQVEKQLQFDSVHLDSDNNYQGSEIKDRQQKIKGQQPIAHLETREQQGGVYVAQLAEALGHHTSAMREGTSEIRAPRLEYMLVMACTKQS
ncbi:hypothetical protein PRIPAC_71781 [Pristionchus pacificus]|uniref:Uncharacterized protein n=1 Tax=Pristionchus pacificus TaxID=54126 RepID=A0A2A6BZP1_PRIPA|nr:hypothetical protein PRIPAC_71781 [Pristionchus pacificus]|eukprot:PDM71472.1 hypothetical protein PRIPAC_37879 [Pristionchus pacificus]